MAQLIERSFRERIILVGVTMAPETTDETEEHLDELVRELAHEADRVRQQHRLTAGQVEPAHARVERGEQPVLHEHPGIGEPVEQRRLAGVRVAHDRDGAVARARPALALRATRRGHGLQLGLELAHAP